MSLLAVGLSHRSAPVSLLERVAVAGDDTGKLLHDLAQSAHVEESLVLSTCNRVEVYAEVARFHGGVTEITELLARASGVGLEELTAHLYVHYEDRAVQHLFTVACGLDSMVRRRGADPRPAARGVPRRAGGRVDRAGGRRCRRAGPAGRQAGARRDRHRPGRRLARQRRAGRTAAPSSVTTPRGRPS